MKHLYDIIPPWELVKQWSDIKPMEDAVVQNWVKIATQAAQWGADQELEACCEVLTDKCFVGQATLVREWRRPKPPSRKEQALEAISRLCASVIHDDLKDDAAIVRRALEQLDD